MKVLQALLFLTWVVLEGVGFGAEPHPRIRRIVIEHLGVFGPDERLDDVPLLPDLTFIFDAANFIHYDTRHYVIRRELLFREGDVADPKLLEESERNLRNLDYLRQSRVLTQPAGPGEVDVIIHVQDTWTTEPRLSFSSGGGSETSEFGIVEKNLFGRGKKITLRRREELDRTSNQMMYDDARIWGSRWHFAGNYEDTSDGTVRQGLIEYPFFALETPWSGGFRLSDLRERNTIFGEGGVERAEFLRKQEFFEARVGHRVGMSTPRVVHRLGAFYRRIDDDFADRAFGPEPELVPEDRLESFPGLWYRREIVRFVRERRLSRFDRIEDLNLGNTLEVEAGYSAKAFEATENEPIVTLLDRQGFDFGPGRKAFLFGLLSTRYADGDVRSGILELEGIAFNRAHLFFEQTFVSRLKLDIGRNLDRDLQLFLGNDNGLRGFDTRELVGTRRVIFNLEDRIFFVNDLFHLVSLGAVLFFDSGAVWNRSRALGLDDFASSVGIGLRIGAPRSADEKIWRFDLAIPLSNAGRDRFMPEFSFGSRQAFVPFVGPFDLQTSGGD
ncbi:MAG: BamA/TamA family outer membrane protein [Candidatus Binatia bacterium]